MIKSLRKFIKQTTANVAIEFAFIAPVLFVLFAGLYDVASFAYAQQRMARLASLIADNVSYGPASKAVVATYLANANALVTPLNFSSGAIIVSDVINLNNTTTASNMRIAWQVSSGVGKGSTLGTTGSYPANMPGGLVLVQFEEAVIVEVYYTYTPLLPLSFLNSSYNIYQTATFPVRGKTLRNLT